MLDLLIFSPPSSDAVPTPPPASHLRLPPPPPPQDSSPSWCWWSAQAPGRRKTSASSRCRCTLRRHRSPTRPRCRHPLGGPLPSPSRTSLPEGTEGGVFPKTGIEWGDEDGGGRNRGVRFCVLNFFSFFGTSSHPSYQSAYIKRGGHGGVRFQVQSSQPRSRRERTHHPQMTLTPAIFL